MYTHENAAFERFYIGARGLWNRKHVIEDVGLGGQYTTVYTWEANIPRYTRKSVFSARMTSVPSAYQTAADRTVGSSELSAAIKAM
jgi:hypothetical protein